MEENFQYISKEATIAMENIMERENLTMEEMEINQEYQVDGTGILLITLDYETTIELVIKDNVIHNGAFYKFYSVVGLSINDLHNLRDFLEEEFSIIYKNFKP